MLCPSSRQRAGLRKEGGKKRAARRGWRKGGVGKGLNRQMKGVKGVTGKGGGAAESMPTIFPVTEGESELLREGKKEGG